MIKNRVHAILTSHGIIVPASDIFGRRGLGWIDSGSHKLPIAERIVMSDLISRASDLMEREGNRGCQTSYEHSRDQCLLCSLHYRSDR